jgi:hypothetical protein
MGDITVGADTRPIRGVEFVKLVYFPERVGLPRAISGLQGAAVTASFIVS